MTRADLGPGAAVGWFAVSDRPNDLAGAGFLIGRRLVLTCAHVVRDHLRLAEPLAADAPTAPVRICFAATGTTVDGHVLAGGWFPNTGNPADGLCDIALIRLVHPVEDILAPSVARRMPTERTGVLVCGAEPGYQSYGQDVDATMRAHNNNRGLRQLDQPGGDGFRLVKGFSGAPALDGSGGNVFGMIAKVDAPGRPVAFAIPADTLRRAMQRAGIEDEARPPDETTDAASAAMEVLRSQLAAQQAEASGLVQEQARELAQLRDIVRTLQGEAQTDQGAASAALQSAAEGDLEPAAVVLRRKAEASTADAARAWRQLGNLLALTDSAGALAALRKAANIDPEDTWVWFDIGEAERRAGTLAGAEDAFARLIGALPETDDRGRATALVSLGDVRMAQGDLSGAASAFTGALRRMERLAQQDPHNSDWQRELSVSHERIGDLRRPQGDLSGAASAYAAALTIRERLARQDPQNSGWQRDLSVGHIKIGDLRRAQGDLPGAAFAYAAALAIAERLARQDPQNSSWQRDLSVSHNKIGDLRRAQRDLPGAASAYAAALTIAERLARQDPQNSSWQRDLSVSHNKIGDLRRAQRDLPAADSAYAMALAIAERLARQDPENSGWQCDLSINHNKIGDLRRAQDDLPGADSAYAAALAIRERLARQDPLNGDWQRDLSVSHNKIGDLRRAQRDLPGAASAYAADLAIAERLTRQYPQNSEWQRDLFVSYANRGEILEAQHDAAGARAAFEQARAIIQPLAAKDPTNAQWRADLQWVQDRLDG